MPKYRVLLLAPLAASPFLWLQPISAGRTAWAITIVATYWASEALPVAVTSLLPIVLFPCLGVLSAESCSQNYFADKIVLFFGGLVVAAALEIVSLHRRLALRVMLAFGTQPRRLLAGFMAATAFLSMWMSNTATGTAKARHRNLLYAHTLLTDLRSTPASQSGHDDAHR